MNKAQREKLDELERQVEAVRDNINKLLYSEEDNLNNLSSKQKDEYTDTHETIRVLNSIVDYLESATELMIDLIYAPSEVNNE